MKTKLLITAVALAALPRLAHADLSEQQKLASSAESALADIAMNLKYLRERGVRAFHDEKRAPDCYAVLEKYKDLKPGAALQSSWFGVVPGAELNEGTNSVWHIRFDQAKWICDEYRDLENQLAAAKSLDQYRQALRGSYEVTQADFEAEGWYAVATGDERDPDPSGPFAKECSAAIDAAIASGLKEDVPVTFSEGNEMTLEALRAGCEAQAEYDRAYTAALVKWAKEKYESVKSVYTAVGIKGDRLELFMQYHGYPWYLPGCDRTTSDPKKLGKAKKLFGWSPQDDGRIIVEKYVFKGNKYTVFEREFYSSEEAYRWCK